MEKRIEEASKETAKQIETAKSKIINSCHSLKDYSIKMLTT